MIGVAFTESDNRSKRETRKTNQKFFQLSYYDRTLLRENALSVLKIDRSSTSRPTSRRCRIFTFRLIT